MKGSGIAWLVLMAAAISTLGWLALKPETVLHEGEQQNVKTPQVLAFAAFLQKNPGVVLNHPEKNQEEITKRLDDSQKAFISELFEEFRKPGRVQDPAWVKNVEDLITVAKETTDLEALDLLREEILSLTSTQDEAQKVLLNRWIEQYQAIEPREEKRQQLNPRRENQLNR